MFPNVFRASYFNIPFVIWYKLNKYIFVVLVDIVLSFSKY